VTDSIKFDFAQINTLAADLGTQPALTGRKLRQAIEVTARHVKDEWAKKLEGGNGVPHAPRSITYDVKATPGNVSTIEAEIGAETGRLQAPIVTVLEFGAPGNNLAPRGYGHGALQDNEADFVKGLELAAEVIL